MPIPLPLRGRNGNEIRRLRIALRPPAGGRRSTRGWLKPFAPLGRRVRGMVARLRSVGAEKLWQRALGRRTEAAPLVQSHELWDGVSGFSCA